MYVGMQTVYLVTGYHKVKGIQGKWLMMYWNPDNGKNYVELKGKMVQVDFDGERAKLTREDI